VLYALSISSSYNIKHEAGVNSTSKFRTVVMLALFMAEN
jgi:hypothetical protein